MMEMEGDRARTIMAMAVARMWKDPEYRKRFISDPKSALSSEGVKFGETTVVKIVEETPTVKYVELGSGEQDPQETLRRMPIPEGQEVRVVQSTANLRYLVLPAAPAWIAPGAASSELMKTEQSPASMISQDLQIETQVAVVAEQTITEAQVMDSQQLEVSVLAIEVQAEAVVETGLEAAAVEYIA